MIRKQTQPNMAKVATIEFGYGSVHLIGGCKEFEDENIGVLYMDTQEPQPVGEKKAYKQPELTRDCDHEVLMTFENIESIDALIASLQDVKKTMILRNTSRNAELI